MCFQLPRGSRKNQGNSVHTWLQRSLVCRGTELLSLSAHIQWQNCWRAQREGRGMTRIVMTPQWSHWPQIHLCIAHTGLLQCCVDISHKRQFLVSTDQNAHCSCMEHIYPGRDPCLYRIQERIPGRSLRGSWLGTYTAPHCWPSLQYQHFVRFPEPLGAETPWQKTESLKLEFAAAPGWPEPS